MITDKSSKEANLQNIVKYLHFKKYFQLIEISFTNHLFHMGFQTLSFTTQKYNKRCFWFQYQFSVNININRHNQNTE